MIREPEQNSDETVIELACHYRADAGAEITTFTGSLAYAWGERTGRGVHGCLITEEQNEVRLNTSFVTGENHLAALAEAFADLSRVLAEMEPVPGVSLAEVTVQVIAGEEHAAHLDALTAR